MNAAKPVPLFIYLFIFNAPPSQPWHSKERYLGTTIPSRRTAEAGCAAAPCVDSPAGGRVERTGRHLGGDTPGGGIHQGKRGSVCAWRGARLLPPPPPLLLEHGTRGRGVQLSVLRGKRSLFNMGQPAPHPSFPTKKKQQLKQGGWETL